MGKRSQEIQRQRREADITPEYLLELETAQPFGPGAPIGSLEYRNFLTGAVHRWTVVRGGRRDTYRLRTPDGRTQRTARGWAWILTRIRNFLVTH